MFNCGCLVPMTLVAMLAIGVQGQIPSFGGCAEYQAMTGFEREKFLGTWYEQERYFTLSELAGKCISATYERRIDGKIYVNNTVVNRFTNVQRIVTGELQDNPAKRTPGQFNVRYSGLPIAYEATMNVLDTDYKTYAVLWSCSQLGPIGHTDTFWVMTRRRLESGPGMQRAYGVLDKFKVSRTFFIKTDQTACETVADQEEAIDPTPSTMSTYGPPQAETGLDMVLLDGAANDTDIKNGNELGPEESLISVGPPDEVLINIAENYVPITNSIGYRAQGKDATSGKDVVDCEKSVPIVEEDKKSKVATTEQENILFMSPVVEVLKKAAEVEP